MFIINIQEIGFLVILFCLYHACIGLILPSLARLRTMYARLPFFFRLKKRSFINSILLWNLIIIWILIWFSCFLPWCSQVCAKWVAWRDYQHFSSSCKCRCAAFSIASASLFFSHLNTQNLQIKLSPPTG